MSIRVWGTSLLMFLSTVTAVGQTANHYLKAPLPNDWEESGEVFQQILPVDDHWWTVFQDATLDSLIHVAVRQNPSVLTVESYRYGESESEDSQRRLLSGFVIGCRVEPPTD